MRTNHARMGGWLWVLAGVGVLALRPAMADKTWTPEQELRAGQEALKQIQGETAPWDNAAQLARCQKLVDTIGPVTTRPEVKYQVHLVQSKPGTATPGTATANAVSLPGGFVCVTRGLLDPTVSKEDAYLSVQSDDELAGILAHEIAHNVLYHGLKQADRDQKYLRGGLVAALAGLVLGGTPAMGLGAFQMVNYIRMGVLSHYSVECEAEADRTAVSFLVKTSYSPVGLLTFMERLAAEERSRVQHDLGVEQTHPYPMERVQMLRRAILAQGVDINTRAVTNWQRAEAMEAVVDGSPSWAVMLWDRQICGCRAAAPTGETPEQRAKAAVDTLNDALAQGMAEFDIQTDRTEAGPRVTLMGKPFITVLPGDLEDPKQSPDEAATGVVRALRAALFSDALKREIKPR